MIDPAILKGKWSQIAKLAVWLAVVASTFVMAPPLLNRNDALQTQSFTRFIIAALLALQAIPLAKYKSKSYYKLWRRIAILSFIATIIATVTYTRYVNNWTVPYYFGKRLVIGKSMLAEARESKAKLANKLNRPFVDDETFVKARQGETQYIWPTSEIESRFYPLSGLYILTMVLVGGFIVTAVQSILCYENP